MHKSERLLIVIAGLMASFAFYRYEFTLEDNWTSSDILRSTDLVAANVGNAPDFKQYSGSKLKKQAFFNYLRPGIALENQRILKERSRLERIEEHFDKMTLSNDDMLYAKRLGHLYHVPLPEDGIDRIWLNRMLHRVDVLPEALVLIQAANESAWGTSRFATKANNYFGQWCYQRGCGLIPQQRAEGKTHEVAKFHSVQESIHGYFMNVNRNNAYYELREIRYKRHMNKKSLTDTQAAIALTKGLLKYSERGEAYVNDLQAMIQHNEVFWN
ncbi:glucosaminidase domain-containing protein [Vibrio sp. TRT 17S01]|uniref:glucosaminidase domain-containing protein n=1 Tax=Vibrio sp. TRT 17S01 TaxID=3418505 RepID=UPI003CEFECEC